MKNKYEVKKVRYGYAVFENGLQVSKVYRDAENADALATVLSWREL